MPIGDLGGRLSQEDMAKVNEKRNPPEFKPGYEDTGGGSFDDLFGDSGSFDSTNDKGFMSGADDYFGGGDGGFDDLFGDSGGNNNNNDFGSSNDPFGNSNGNLFGDSNGFGNGSFTGLNGLNGQNNFQNNQQPKNPTLGDRFGEYSTEAISSLGSILVEMVKSIATRTADDFAAFSSNMIKVGGVIGCSGLLLSLIGGIANIRFLAFNGIGSHLILSSALSIGTGLIFIGSAAYIITNSAQESAPNMDDLSEAASEDPEDATDVYEDSLEATLDDLFGSDDDDSLFGGDDDGPDTSDISSKPEPEPEPVVPNYSSISIPKIDFNKAVDQIEPAGALTREKLFNTFESFLVENTPEFAIRTEIDPGSQEFLNYETVCIKALANILNVELSEVNSKLEKAYETYFSLEFKLKRVRKLNNTDQIAIEIEHYMRSNSNDTSVNVTVTIEGDFYKIIVTKGESAIITLGDIFKQEYCRKYFLDTKHKLPMITGISELGEVILDDAKLFDTMLIAGKPRSGKSWYVLGILMNLMMFNTPEQVQFVIVDPKESNLFNTVSLMPHVCGLHTDKNILDLLDDIIDNESARRKKIIAENKCEDIWALWDKGVKLPILYLVIDEYITVKNNLGENSKELDAKIQTIISQLPSQGIRLLFVPHRATGVVNKTNRTMLQFTAAVRSDVDDVKDTLGIKKWDRSLTNPGDIAVKTSSSPNAMYVRGAALTTSDEENAKMIRGVAKAFYRLGVEMPDTSSMVVASNRVEAKVQQELGLSDRYYRYDAGAVKLSSDTLMKEDSSEDFTSGLKYDIDDFMKDFN